MGPLSGVRVVELAGAGPTPFACMLLSDMGADVVRIDRREQRQVLGVAPADILGRGRKSVCVDLGAPEGVECVLRLVAGADALVEGFRPGVAERLGVGPEPCMGRNPRLVYARSTGWGQDGPLRDRPGHDINYISVAGALHPIGPPDRPPVPPLSLVGDFGGGLLLAFGVVSSLFEARVSGTGQIVDSAMVDAAALMTTVFHELRAKGLWSDERGTNLVDGGAPFYGAYETADHSFVAVGAMEPEFFAALADLVGLTPEQRSWYADPGSWSKLHGVLSATFLRRTREEWCDAAGSDACLSPVLSLAEAPHHPFNTERSVFVDVDGTPQPAPAPRLSRTPPRPPSASPRLGEHTDAVLLGAGYDPEEIARLRGAGVVGAPGPEGD